MCIALLLTAGATITDKQLSNCNANNPDGMGFAYVSTDYAGVKRLKTFKTMDYEHFLKKFNRARKHHLESPFLIHFRIATHGTVDRFNCHPFKINKNMAFIHNGIITSVGTDPKKSDTQLFNEKVLKQLPKGWDKNDAITVLLEKFLLGSKVLTLDIDGNVNIYNEHTGHWKDGIWFSNNSYSYEPRKVVTYQYPVTTYDNRFKYGKKKQKSIEDTVMFYCTGCSMMVDEDDCHFFLKYGDPKCYCTQCKVAAFMNGDVTYNDGCSKWKYQIEVRKGEFYDHHTDSYHDFCGMD